ncbi:helix-turn-helix domain-containing protein [Sphingomonas silueang]|uniref:helix-turn-helix domain-containing protein n=1 Tax=Sphingomonas silueang TaxID=3156617 RepID=UPI003CCD321E
MGAAPHPEDIKAAIRKRFRTIAAFERSAGLPKRSVKDVLRGRSRPTVARAIADGIGKPVHKLFPNRFKAPHGDSLSTASPPLHRKLSGGEQ